jgi:hypothetical protein
LIIVGMAIQDRCQARLTASTKTSPFLTSRSSRSSPNRPGMHACVGPRGGQVARPSFVDDHPDPPWWQGVEERVPRAACGHVRRNRGDT